MAKFANTSVLDALLDKVATGTQLIVCTTQPADRAAALATALASTSLAGGDFTKAAGTPNGRQVTIAQKANISVTASGSAAHVAIVDGTSLLYVTTVTAQTLTSGNTVTVPSWKITVADPS